MNYWKLFLPLAVVITLTSLVPLIEGLRPEYSSIAGVIITGVALIYYLRVDNAGTSLINTLTILLLSVLAGEYFIQERFTLGIALISIGNLAFALIFVFRQKLKSKKDKNSGIKAAAVFAYGLSMIFSFAIDIPAILVIGSLALTGGYFYDRLIQISEGKNRPRQKV